MILGIVNLAVKAGRTCGAAAGTYNLYALVLSLYGNLEYIFIEVSVTYAGQYDTVEFSIYKGLHGQG